MHLSGCNGTISATEAFTHLSSMDLHLAIFLVMARDYFSRQFTIGLVSKRVHMSSLFYVTNDETTLHIKPFIEALEIVMRRFSTTSVEDIVERAYTIFVSNIHKDVFPFLLTLMNRNDTPIEFDYKTYMRLCPQTKPYLYQFPSIGSKQIISFIRPKKTVTPLSSLDQTPDNVIVQFKYDGERAILVFTTKGRVYLVTRQGFVRAMPDGWKEDFLVKYAEGEKHDGDFLDLSSLNDKHILHVVDAELLAVDSKGQWLPATSVSSISKYNSVDGIDVYGKAMIFDALKLNGVWIVDLTLRERLAMMNEVFGIEIDVSKIRGSYSGVKSFSCREDFEVMKPFMQKFKLDGFIYKDLTSRYGGLIDVPRVYNETSQFEYLNNRWNEDINHDALLEVLQSADKPSYWFKYKYEVESTFYSFGGNRGSSRSLNGVITSITYGAKIGPYYIPLGSVPILKRKDQKMFEEIAIGNATGEQPYTRYIQTPKFGVQGVPTKPSAVLWKEPILIDICTREDGVISCRKEINDAGLPIFNVGGRQAVYVRIRKAEEGPSMFDLKALIDRYRSL